MQQHDFTLHTPPACREAVNCYDHLPISSPPHSATTLLPLPGGRATILPGALGTMCPLPRAC